MTEEEFRFQDHRRRIEILRNNAAMFRRRTLDPTYGTQQDRMAASLDFQEAAREIARMTRGE